MIWHNTSVNDKGRLVFAGHDTTELAAKYGTPLYIMDEGLIRERCRIYKIALDRGFGPSLPLFASKALCCKRLYEIVAEEGLGTDVVSGGELHIARSAGFPMEKVYFHGNAKPDAEIRYALECGVGCFVVDNMDELRSLDGIAGELGKKQKILLRLTPDIDPHTFEAVSTGKVDSKFGMAITTGQAEEAVRFALSLPNVELAGFHCHIGSQVFDGRPFVDSAEVMLRFIAEMKEKCGFETSELDLGGGFGVRYTGYDPSLDIGSVILQVSEYVRNKCAELGIKLPKILMEPGRSIVGDAGATLYTVESVKTITGYKSYVAVDGGMTDNPRYALYRSKYTAFVANKADRKPDFLCTIAGRCCEGGDLIQEDILLTKPERGDLVAVMVTGAYNHAMSSNYNAVCRPPIVMLTKGGDYVAVRRETYEDLTSRDM